MNKVIITKGLPASGKTTWAKEWIRKSPNRVRISSGDIRDMMRAACEDTYSTGCEAIIQAATLNILENCLILHKDIVLDNTNLNKQTLKKQLEICEKYQAVVEYKTFYTTPEECVRRDAKRENPVGEEIIMTMFAKHKKELVMPKIET